MSIPEVTMLRSELEEIHSILTTLHNKAIAEDLLQSYSSMGKRSTTSAITLAIDKQIEKIDVYLSGEGENDSIS